MNVVGIKKRKKGKFFKIVITLIIVAFLGFNIFKIPVFHSITNSVAAPVFATKDFLLKPFDNFFSYFQSKNSLAKKNEELEKQIDSLQLQVLSDKIIRLEYQSLLKQHNSQTEDQPENIAKVALKPPYSSFDSLLVYGDFTNVDNGTKIFFENVVLGEVADHTNDSANIKLYSASGNSIVGQLPTGDQVDIIGKGFGRYEITLPKDIEIKQGDVISLPSQEIVTIGVVNEVFISEDELFNKVLFNIPVEFSDMNYVRVGTPLDVLE